MLPTDRQTRRAIDEMFDEANAEMYDPVDDETAELLLGFMQEQKEMSE